MKKLLLLLITIIMLGTATTVSAISLSEKEDIYRVDEFLGYSLDKEYVINWLIEDDNFIYHLHETAPEEYVNRFVLEPALTALNIGGEILSGNVSAAFEAKEDYYSALKDILLSFSTDESILNTSELKSKVRMEYLNTFKNDLVNYAFSMPETANLAAYIDGVQVTKQLDSIDDLYSNIANAAVGEGQQRLWDLIDDYKASTKFAENLSNVSEVVKYATKGVEVARFSYDLIIELETYNTINSQMTGVLKDIYEYSTNSDVKKVAGELYAKTMNSKQANLSAAVDEIYGKIGEVGGETALMLGMEIVSQKLAVPNVVAYAQLGITLGNLFSDLAFGTSDIREQLTYIEATDAISKTLAQRLRYKLKGYQQTFFIRDGRYEERAVAAKDIILYSKLLLQTRMMGEEAYYKFKATVYDSGMSNIVVGTIDDLFSILGVNLTTPYDKIDKWWNDRCADFNTAYKILYSYIDVSMYEDMYEINVPKDDFVFEDDKLISYIGNGTNVSVPYRAYTIGTGAFDTEIYMQELTIRGKVIETQAIRNCMVLSSLYIPKSIKTIENDAIYNCPNVTIYGYTGSVAEAYAKNNGIPFVSIGTTEYDDGTYVNGYTLSEGTLDLDGQTMYVGGDFLHTGGTLNLGSGKLVIFGDYKISSYYKQTATGVILTYSGNLDMSHENGKMIVYGTFINQSLYSNLTAGTIEIKGDFKQQTSTYTGSSYRYNNFSPSGTHKVILSGTGEQNISFQNPGDSYFNILEIKNTSGLIHFAPLSVKGEIIGDIISNNDININGSSITLKNQKLVSPNIHITNNSNVSILGEVQITGNLYNSYGMLNIKGYLDLNGNYISSCETKQSATGVYFSYSGHLYMDNNNGYFKVTGNYTENAQSNSYTNGILEITGDFSQAQAYTGYDYSRNNFNPRENHKVILSGTGEQNISFQNPGDSYFNILESKNTSGMLKFNSLSVKKIVGSIISNYDISFKNIILDLSDISIYSPNIYIEGGSSITISGNVNIIGNLHNTYGSLYIKGQLNLKGNYVSVSKYISTYNGTSGYLCMETDNAYMIVHHNFETSSSYNTLKAGTLEIKGNFSQYTGIDSSAYGVYDNFKATGTHKVVLSGLEKQVIAFTNPDKSYFNILINQNPNGVVFATAYRYNELQTIYPFDFEVAEYNAETNQINVDVILSEDLQSLKGNVIISLYDESNKLIDCRIKELSELEPQTFNGLKDYEGTYIVKAFCWADMTSIKPLCPSIQKELATK